MQTTLPFHQYSYSLPPPPAAASIPRAPDTSQFRPGPLPPSPYSEVTSPGVALSSIACDAAVITPQAKYISRSRHTIAPPSLSIRDTPLQMADLPSASASTSPSSVGLSVAPSKRDARPKLPGLANDSLVVKGPIAHPYARLYSKKQGAGRRRKMWNLALEKLVFTPQEISTMGAPTRRTIYTATLEANIDRLHEQLRGYRLAPVPPEKLEPYRGLNMKTCKSMISGLHHDAVEIKVKILEIDRAIKNLQDTLNSPCSPYFAM